jgi:hypothetical protein
MITACFDLVTLSDQGRDVVGMRWAEDSSRLVATGSAGFCPGATAEAACGEGATLRLTTNVRLFILLSRKIGEGCPSSAMVAQPTCNR